MSLEAIRIGVQQDKVEMSWCTLELKELETLKSERSDDLPLAYAVKNARLDALRAPDLAGRFTDRGRKNKATGLSHLLMRQPGIPFIDGSYTDTGQLIRSLRTLLLNARKADERNVYIVGIDETVFAELAAHAGAAGPRDEFPPVHLFDLLCKGDVPARLCERLVGTSREIQFVRHLIVRAAKQAIPVLILGDPGTGKEIVARAIHDLSDRADEQFVPVNCAAIPHELLEAELFGYVKGAFTGAAKDRDGLWLTAGKGTLFLDEIADLAPDHQAKVLRALESQRIRRVGDEVEKNAPARVIAATNRDLASMLQNKQFRDDLYYRLRTLTIRTPAVRDHAKDIPVLVKKLWKDITQGSEPELSKELVAELAAQAWPGNVRQLRTTLAGFHTLFLNEPFGLPHLRAFLEHEGQTSGSQPSRASADEFGVFRVDCLHQLRQTDDVLRACKVGLRPVVVDHRTDGASVASARAAVRQHLEELDILCLHPLQFHSEATFRAVYRLKGRLSHFQSLLAANVGEAIAYWEKEVPEQFDLALHAVFEEVDGLFRGH